MVPGPGPFRPRSWGTSHSSMNRSRPMRRLPSLRAVALASGVLIVVAIGTRPALRAQHADPAIGTAAIAGSFGGAAEDKVAGNLAVVPLASPPMSLAATKVWLSLQEKVTFNFPNDTPLEDILKYIKS